MIPNELNGVPNPYNTFGDVYYLQSFMALLEGLGVPDIDYYLNMPPNDLREFGKNLARCVDVANELNTDEKPTRYFLFAYEAVSLTRMNKGNVLVTSRAFPSVSVVADMINDTLVAATSVAILGWQEFKSKEDYENFEEKI